jgi:hypothetical protein
VSIAPFPWGTIPKRKDFAVSKTYAVAVLLALAALVFSSPQVIQVLWPTLGRSTVLAIYIGCTLLTVALVVASIVAAMWEDDPAARWRRKTRGFKRKIIQRSLGALLIILVGAWYFRPLDPFRKDIPGLSIYVLLTQYDVPDYQQHYIFQFGSAAGPRYELFVSASNTYTFSVTDIHGTVHPLEMRIGSEGVPLHELVGILAEIGFTEKSTILRVAVNGEEISRTTLPLIIDMSGAPNGGNLGSNQSGEQHGNFVIKRLTVWQVALSTSNIADVDAQAKK